MELIENDITANGVKLHVYRTNTEKQPLVFAHGMSDNGLCYRPIAEHFTNGYEIVLYDAREHGKSEAPGTKTELIDRARDLAGLIDVLGLQKPDLIGHSMGAVTVALFAGLYPHIPGHIVLEDPPPFEILAAKDEQSLTARKAWKEDVIANKQKSIQELIELNRQENPTWPEAERQPWALAKQQFNLNAFNEELVDVESRNQIVSQITCPTLIITADLDKNSAYPPQAADELVARLPNARHVNITGAGHNIRREQPEAFITTVGEFLKKADG